MRGSAPRAPTCGDKYVGRCPTPRLWGKEYMRGSASRSDHAVVYMRGFTPHPDLGSFFGKKRPKNPKKPNCGGFILSSIDSEQGCRRQPCFVFWQSNSNFIVSLPNASKGREGATVPAVAALTLPRPAQGREKDNSFPPLCIPPFL